MLKLGINYCGTGLMSVCKAADNVVDQILCDFNPCDAKGDAKLDCPHLRKDMGNHCDHIEAQWAARHGGSTVAIKALTEETVFDIRDKETYPVY